MKKEKRTSQLFNQDQHASDAGQSQFSEADRLRAKISVLQEENRRLQIMRHAQYNALYQQRTDLLGRVMRIEQQIIAMAFEVPEVPSIFHPTVKAAN